MLLIWMAASAPMTRTSPSSARRARSAVRPPRSCWPIRGNSASRPWSGAATPTALAAIGRRLRREFAALADERRRRGPRGRRLPDRGIACGAGESAVIEAVERDAGHRSGGDQRHGGPAARPRAALKPGRRIAALANKESLVCAGEAFMAQARRLGVDDHAGRFRAQRPRPGARRPAVSATSRRRSSPPPAARSGPGARERIAAATPAEAAAHPVWSMGSKINIDSATLMNKGLELIEAHHLFGLEAERARRGRASGIDRPWARPVARRGADGRARAPGHEGSDRQCPAASAVVLRMDLPRLDLAAIGQLNLRGCRTRTASRVWRWPALPCAAAARCPTVLNAANEIAVAAFMARPDRILCDFGRSLSVFVRPFPHDDRSPAPATVADALALDEEARGHSGAGSAGAGEHLTRGPLRDAQRMTMMDPAQR